MRNTFLTSLFLVWSNKNFELYYRGLELVLFFVVLIQRLEYPEFSFAPQIKILYRQKISLLWKNLDIVKDLEAIKLWNVRIVSKYIICILFGNVLVFPQNFIRILAIPAGVVPRYITHINARTRKCY